MRDFLTPQGFIGVGGGRFFINGVDTETEGVDVVVNWPVETARRAASTSRCTANFNDTDVTKVPQTPQLAALSPPPVLFDRFNVLTFEEGTPENKFSAQRQLEARPLGARRCARRATAKCSRPTALRRSRRAAGTLPNDITLGAKTLVDLEGRFDITDNIRVALGAENLLDEYPDANPAGCATRPARTSFSNYSPFGRSGRFVYGRLSYKF